LGVSCECCDEGASSDEEDLFMMLNQEQEEFSFAHDGPGLSLRSKQRSMDFKYQRLLENEPKKRNFASTQASVLPAPPPEPKPYIRE
jgi:hypothetical protein